VLGQKNEGNQMGGTCCTDRRGDKYTYNLVGNHVGDVGSYWNAGGGVGWV
jgi:hypothetical protein